MLECENTVYSREICIIWGNFTVCSHAAWLPLQTAVSLSSQIGFLFSFLRMNYSLLGEMVLRGP